MKQEKSNTKLHKAVKEIRTISMTTEEKVKVLEDILRGTTFVECPQESPYMKYPFVSLFHKKSILYASSALLFTIFVSTGATLASAYSLPGDMLYPFKVNIVEPSYGAFAFSNESKIKHENSLITKRLVEAEVLAEQNNLDQAKEDQINSLLENHTKAFAKAIVEFRTEDTTGQDMRDELVINFQAEMNAHAEVLDLINQNDDASQTPRNIKISQTARDQALQVRNELKNKTQNNQPETKKTKDIVQSLIDKTTLDISNVAEVDASKKQVIIDNSNKKLEHARQLLKEVDEEEKKGNKESAREKLLDSESAAKEAGIFLNLGLNLGIKS